MTSQLVRFATLNSHQLAGHVSNLEFWAGEVAHCLDVIDQYNARFDRLAEGQASYVAAHDTIAYLPGDPHDEPCLTPRPKRIPHRQRSDTRRELCDAYYRLLVRCQNSGLIDEPTLRQLSQRHDISVDRRDLKGRER